VFVLSANDANLRERAVLFSRYSRILTGVLMFRGWLMASIRARHHWRATWNVDDLSFFSILRCMILRHIGMRIVMRRAVLSDQARALDPPIVFSK
jgi:hypothetical protein